MTRISGRSSLLVLALASPVVFSQQQAAQEVAPPDVSGPRPQFPRNSASFLAQRWEAVDRLLESRFGAWSENENTGEAKQLRQDAKAALASAKQAIADGELERAESSLSAAMKLIFNAERARRLQTMPAEQAKREVMQQSEGLRALIAAGRWLAAEKQVNRPEFDQAQELAGVAERLAEAGKHAAALDQLDQARALCRRAIAPLRPPRPLPKPPSIAEQFKYEQGRNDDYLGLADALIQHRDASWAERTKLARSLRTEADRLALANAFESALKKINESSEQVKTLLRRVGFPIF